MINRNSASGESWQVSALRVASQTCAVVADVNLFDHQAVQETDKIMNSVPCGLAKGRKQSLATWKQLYHIHSIHLLDKEWSLLPWRKRAIYTFSPAKLSRERRKGSSRRQHTARRQRRRYQCSRTWAAAQSMPAGERKNGARRYIQHDRSCTPSVDACLCWWQLPLSPPSHPSPALPPSPWSGCLSPSLSLSLSLALSLSEQLLCFQKCGCVQCT